MTASALPLVVASSLLGLLPAVAAATPSAEAEFEAVVSKVAERPHDESCAAMEEWIARHPGSPDRARGLLWMARLRRMDGRDDLARPLLERAVAVAQGSAWELPAAKELADLDLASRSFGRALATYDRLAAGKDPFWSSVGRLSAREARETRNRFYLVVAVASALALFVAVRLGLAARGGRRPWIPPREALIALPVAVLLAVLAHRLSARELRAILTLAFGAVALLWAAGATLRGGGRLTRWRRAGEVGLGLAQTAALLYCALAGNDLWGKLMSTLTYGAGE